MILEHLVMPRGREALKKMMGTYHKDTGASLKSCHLPNLGQLGQQNSEL